jgi:hypothetical protein
MEINSFLVLEKPMQVSYQEMGAKATRKTGTFALMTIAHSFLTFPLETGR